MWKLTLLDIGAGLMLVLFIITLVDTLANATEAVGGARRWQASAASCAACLALFALFYGASLRFPG